MSAQDDDRIAQVLERLTDVLELLVEQRQAPASPAPAATPAPRPRRGSGRHVDVGPVDEVTRAKGRTALARAGIPLASTGRAKA